MTKTTTKKRRAADAGGDLIDPTMLSFDLDSAFGFLVRRVNSLANALFAQMSGQTEITPMQMGILVTVHQSGSISLRDLTSKMRVDRSTLQEVVKRIVDRGLLTKTNPPNDKRAHVLQISPAGLNLLRLHFGAMQDFQAHLLGLVSKKDAEITLRTLKAMADRHDY